MRITNTYALMMNNWEENIIYIYIYVYKHRHQVVNSSGVLVVQVGLRDHKGTRIYTLPWRRRKKLGSQSLAPALNHWIYWGFLNNDTIDFIIMVLSEKNTPIPFTSVGIFLNMKSIWYLSIFQKLVK